MTELYYNTVQDAAGNVVNGATITVYQSGGAVATIYDAAGAPMANPFLSGLNRSEGEVEFSAANGLYDIKIVTATETDWIYRYSLFDQAELTASASVRYDPTISGLTAVNVKAAIDEVYSAVGTGISGVARYADAVANFTGDLQVGGISVGTVTQSDVSYELLDVNGDVGTTAGTLAIGDHLHTGVYEPIDSDIARVDVAANFTAGLQAGGSDVVVDTDIGVTVQAYSSTNALTGDITYETLNTNGDVGTTAGTLAIGNHVHAASAVTYSNTVSGLTATQVQAAIDEIAAASVLDLPNWDVAAQVGNGLSVAAMDQAAVTALSGTEVAISDRTTGNLYKASFNGTDWSIVGNALTITPAGGWRSLAALNSTDVAFFDLTNDSLRTYRFDGTNWALVGSGLAIATADHAALAALNSTDVAFFDQSNDSLRTYRFNGTTWAIVGSGLSITPAGIASITALNSTDVAFIDVVNDSLRTYRFDGTNWSLVGSGLAIAAVDTLSIAALNETDVAFIDGNNDSLRTYRFDGTNWSQVGSGLVIATVGSPALAALNGTDVAFIDGTNDSLRTYRFGTASKPAHYDATVANFTGTLQQDGVGVSTTTHNHTGVYEPANANIAKVNVAANFTAGLQAGGVNVTTSAGTTGGTGSAGAGNQYLELTIGGVTYKLLHDGTV